MTITGTDRYGWLRLAAAMAIALLAIGVGVASVADSAGAKPSKGKNHNGKSNKKGKGGAKAGTYTFKGRDPKADSGELSEVKVKFNGAGVPVKVLDLQVTGLGECTAVGPSVFGTEYDKPIAVKTKKVKGKAVKSFQQKVSSSSPIGSDSGTVGGTFTSDYKKLKVSLDYTSTKNLVENGPLSQIVCTVKAGFVLKR